MYLLLGSFVLLIVAFYYLKRELNYWKVRNVPYEKGKIIVGNLGASLLMQKSMADIFGDVYKKFRSYKYCGIFQFRVPALLIIDPNLVRDVLATKFQNFHDIPVPLDEEKDPVLSKNPFFAKGEKWKLIRAQLTPQFTSSKVKAMFPLIKEIGQRLVKYLDDERSAVNPNGINAKELCNKFTADAVASCAFGVDGRSFVDPNTEFLALGRKIMEPGLLETILFYALSIFPEMEKLILPKYINDDVANRFKKIIFDNLSERESNGISRGDFLDAVAEMRKTTTAFDYTIDYVVAHAMSFFLDGFETSAIVLQFLFYELGANLDVQEKLRKEINDVLKENNDNITCDSLQDMKYLDLVLQETLRKHPPLSMMMRKCTESTVIEPATVDGKPLVVEEGTIVFIPVLSIHYDPQYYPDPEKFDPERFNQSFKESRPKNTYLPFGDGPRICIGRRFGITQIKVASVSVLQSFEIHVNKKTKVPFELDPLEFLYAVRGGVWLDFHKISCNKNETVK